VPRTGDVRGAAHPALSRQGFRRPSAGQNHSGIREAPITMCRPRDPDSLATKQQSDADALAEETEREIRKHREKKEEKETLLAAGQKDAAEVIEFLNARTLRSTTLNSGHPDAGGWVLFSTKSKWIDDLQKQEEFVLRVPLGNRIVEFPFSLPPSEGDLILRRRPEN
jgi:hypothetical protein